MRAIQFGRDISKSTDELEAEPLGLERPNGGDSDSLGDYVEKERL